VEGSLPRTGADALVGRLGGVDHPVPRPGEPGGHSPPPARGGPFIGAPSASSLYDEMWTEPEPERSEYKPAAVCRRGHVQSRDLTVGEVGERCSKCGAKVLTGCPKCGKRIRGRYEVPGVVSLGGKYTPPNFCDSCGHPFPWLDRQGRIFELENLLDDEDLDEATELAVREQLRALASPDLDETEERQRWERVKRNAPGLWEKSGARAILESVVSAAVKGSLGL
jgi:hypothetical protein